MNFPLFQSKTYPVRFKCQNCKQVQAVPIPKGMTVKDFIAQQLQKCPACGCTDMDLMNKELLK